MGLGDTDESTSIRVFLTASSAWQPKLRDHTKGYPAHLSQRDPPLDSLQLCFQKNPSTLEKAFRYSNLQQELGRRVQRGISVLTIEHSGQRPRVGSHVNSCLETRISAGPFPFLGEVSCMGWSELGSILTL